MEKNRSLPEPSRRTILRRVRLPHINTRETFAALRFPNYKLWFYGQMASLFGTWMQSTAQGYLVYQLTNSPAYLGYVGFASGLPSWLFMLYGGVISDRMPRRKLLVITQLSMMVLALVLAALAFTGTVQPWHIIVLAFLLGVANAFDAPARQAFTLEMVSRDSLSNAIALNAAMFNTATAVGPAIGGMAYAAFGPGWCFVINAVSFVAVIWALLKMRLQPFIQPIHRGTAMADLREGLRYVLQEKTIRSLILIVGMSTLLGLSFVTLFPAWAVNILNGDATTNGLLQSARGVGALAGALTIASLGQYPYRGKLVTGGMIALPVLGIGFAYIRWLPLSLLALVGIGFSTMMLLNLCNALVQSIVPDELRGRVMGIYLLTFMGIMPVGSLFVGYLAEGIGSPSAVIISSSVLLAFALLSLWWLPEVRKLK